MGAVDQLVDPLAVGIGEHVAMVPQDGDDELDGLHGHVPLLVQGHGDNAIFELAREQLEFALQLLASVERLQGLQAFEPDVSHLVVNGPADVLEVRVVQEVVGELLHPLANLEHADRPDLRQGIPVAMHEHGFEHVGEHVLDLLGVLLELFATSHQGFQTIGGPLVAGFLLLRIVLPLGIVEIDGNNQGNVNQGGHQLHGGQGGGVPESSDLRIRELSQERDDVVHEVLVVDD